MRSQLKNIAGAALIAPVLVACGGPERTVTRDSGYYGGETVRTVPADSSYGYNDYRCSNCGVVTDIEQVRTEGSGVAGAVIGGVVGGVAGHQVGKGTGKDLATAAGAVGGAIAGHEIEQNRSAKYEYRVRVRMDNGDVVTVNQEGRPPVAVGDQVRVVDGRVVPRG